MPKNKKLNYVAKNVGPQVSAAEDTQLHHPVNQVPYREAYSVKEVSLLLNLSARSLRRLENRKLLVPSRGLRCKRFLRSDLLAYLEGTK